MKDNFNNELDNALNNELENATNNEMNNELDDAMNNTMNKVLDNATIVTDNIESSFNTSIDTPVGEPVGAPVDPPVDPPVDQIPFVKKISIGLPDILLTLTVGGSKTPVVNFVGKMFVLRELHEVFLDDVAVALSLMKIEKFFIVSVCKYPMELKSIVISDPMDLTYIEVGSDHFLSVFKQQKFDFMEFNRDTLYIMRDSNYIDVKNLLTNIKGYDANLGRGGSQKSHVLSPLDFRLSTYLLALFNMNSRQVSYLNTFNDLTKDRYLPYVEKKFDFKSIFKKAKESIDKENIENPKEPLINTVSNKNVIKKFDGKPLGTRGYHTSTKTELDKNKRTENKTSVFSYLDSLEDIIKNSNSFNEAQLKIETSWVDLMMKKLEDPSVSSWRMLPVLIKKAVSTLEKYENRGILKRRFKLFNLELSRNKMEIVLLTIAMLVSNYNRMSATNISIHIGNSIAFLLFKENIVYDEKINLKLKFEHWKKTHDLATNAKLLKLGDYFVNLFTNEPTQIFEFGLDEDDIIETNSERIIKISPEYIQTIKESLIVHPTSLPMLCEPGEWSDTSFGGFLENKFNQDPINTGSEYHGHTIEKKESLYKAINILNKIKFNVNKELLEYILTDGSYLLEGKDSEKKEFQNSITLEVAKIYSNFTFYLNVNCDWRSRLYTNSFFLTYQGSDLSRSLLEFAEGEKLTDEGLKYLYIFGANCYSDIIGKKSISYRVSWVKNNLKSIIELDKKFINEANKKVQFASFCLAMKNYQLNNEYLVKLPVFLDATCSGIQHLAAMLKDINLGTHVNLLAKTEEDDVNDLYGTVVDPLNKAINKFGKENVMYSSLSNVKLTRKIIKTPIMTQVYSVTVEGIYRQLIKKLRKEIVAHPTDKTEKGKPRYNTFYFVPDKEGKEILISYTDVYKIAEIVKNISFDMYPSLKDIYNYFINSVKLMLKLNVPIIWFTPAGLEISQHYFVSEITKVKLSYFGKTRTSVIREWKGIVDKRKQNQSIVPNIIHSLDASHLINVINCGYKKDIYPIISIHDCFGTHPNTMNKLAKIVRSEFVLLYTQHNFLQKYNEKILINILDNGYEIIEKDGEKYVEYFENKKRKDGTEYISTKKKLYLIPDVPKMGSLDLKEIINAIYLIN